MTRNLFQGVFGLILLGSLAALAEEPTSEPATQPVAVSSGQEMLNKLGEGFIPLVESSLGGEINWTDGEIYAIGTARLAGRRTKDFMMAQRAARVMAARNALLLMARIHLGTGGRFRDVKNGNITLEAVMKDFEEVDSDYDPQAQTVTSVVGVPIHGARGLVQMRGIRFGRATARKGHPTRDVEKTDVVIIDARGTEFIPSLSPRVVGPKGDTLAAGGTDADGNLLQTAYLCYKSPFKNGDMAAALADRGFNVLILKAIGAEKDKPTTLKLSEVAVWQWEEHPEAAEQFLSGKLIILADELKPKEKAVNPKK